MLSQNSLCHLKQPAVCSISNVFLYPERQLFLCSEQRRFACLVEVVPERIEEFWLAGGRGTIHKRSGILLHFSSALQPLRKFGRSHELAPQTNTSIDATRMPTYD